MSSWLPVDLKDADSTKKKTKNGVTVQVSVSPYDIPEAVRGYQRNEDGWFVIEFRYPVDEPLETTQKDPNIRIVTGKHSHRLYQIQMNVVAAGANIVELRLRLNKAKERAFEALEEHRTKHPSLFSSLRSDVVKRVITAKDKDLFSSLPVENDGCRHVCSSTNASLVGHK